MKGKGFLFGAIGALALANPIAEAQASARTLTLSAAMIPYVYRYAACLFDASNGTAQTRIDSCQDLRQALVQDSRPVFEKWHRSDSLRRERQFARALDLLEDEARFAEVEREPVPAGVIRYLQCTGDHFAQDERFLKGVVIDFVGQDLACQGVRDGDLAGEERRLETKLINRLRFEDRWQSPADGQLNDVEFRYGLLAPRSFGL